MTLILAPNGTSKSELQARVDFDASQDALSDVHAALKSGDAKVTVESSLGGDGSFAYPLEFTIEQSGKRFGCRQESKDAAVTVSRG